MTDPVSENDQSTAYLAQAVQDAVEALMPSILQAVRAQLVADPNAGDTADVDPTESPDDSETAAPDSPDADADLDDDEASKYSVMSPDCQAAYLAGRKKGMAAQRYSRTSNSSHFGNDIHRVVARQQAQLGELRNQIERERRDLCRYSRLNELSREFAFDVNEELETTGDMSDPQFERHCRVTIAKYSRRDDVTNVELFNDPNLESDLTNRPGIARAKVDQIERYSREAASIAARKNAGKRGSTTFEVEFEAICKQHGITV